ncbi:MAG: PAS domain S-box protein [Rhodanobacteraceae bacterium]
MKSVAPARLRPTRAVYMLALITVVAIVMLVASLLINLRRQSLLRSHRETAGLVRMLSAQTEQSFRSADLALKGVQDRMQSPYGSQLKLDSMPVQLLLRTRINGLHQVRALFIVDAAGMVRNASDPGVLGVRWNVPGSDFKALSEAAPSSLYISSTSPLGAQADWTVYLARRLIAEDGKFHGVAVAAMDLGYFEDYFAYLTQGAPRRIGLYHADGRLIASLPHRDQALGHPAAELDGLNLARAGMVPVKAASLGGVASGDQLLLAQVRDFNLLIGVRENDSLALAAWRQRAVPIALGALLACIFIAIAAILLAIELRREGKLSSALREADDRYRLTIHSVMDAIISIDAAQTIVMFNRSAERMFGFPAAEAIGMPVDKLLPQRDRKAHAEHIEAFMAADVASREMALQMEIHGLRRDGVEFPIESAISKTLINGKPELTAVLRDVTERRRKDVELREINSELRRLSAALQSVREEERKRISRELHDDLGQQLAGLKLEITWFGERMREGRNVTSAMLDSMHAMLDRAIHSVRHISTELRPWILEELDLGNALAWQVEEATRRTNIRYECHLPAASLIQDDSLATAIFRIVQEALSNVVRHADAQSVAVRLVREQDELVLTVRDSGRGFSHDFGGRGIGLVGMRERSNALGGRFNVASEIGQGTIIEVRVPLSVPVAVEEETP